MKQKTTRPYMDRTRRKAKNYMEPGHPVTTCDRCGLVQNEDQILEEHTGMYVCNWCYDERPEDMDTELYMDYEQDFPEYPRIKTYPEADACDIAGRQAVIGQAVIGCMIIGQRNRFGT